MLYIFIIQKYRTIGIFGLPTPPISPFIRGSAVYYVIIVQVYARFYSQSEHILVDEAVVNRKALAAWKGSAGLQM
jgi:hypothetical protein